MLQPSLDQGIECHRTNLPMVNNCGWSGAYYAMEHIYGGLTAPEPHMLLKGYVRHHYCLDPNLFPKPNIQVKYT